MRHVIAFALILAACGEDRGPPVATGERTVLAHVQSFHPAYSQYEGRIYVTHDAEVLIVRDNVMTVRVPLPKDCPTSPVRQIVGRDIQMRETFERYRDGTVDRTITGDDAVRALCVGFK